MRSYRRSRLSSIHLAEVPHQQPLANGPPQGTLHPAGGTMVHPTFSHSLAGPPATSTTSTHGDPAHPVHLPSPPSYGGGYSPDFAPPTPGLKARRGIVALPPPSPASIILHQSLSVPGAVVWNIADAPRAARLNTPAGRYAGWGSTQATYPPVQVLDIRSRLWDSSVTVHAAGAFVTFGDILSAVHAAVRERNRRGAARRPPPLYPAGLMAPVGLAVTPFGGGGGGDPGRGLAGGDATGTGLLFAPVSRRGRGVGRAVRGWRWVCLEESPPGENVWISTPPSTTHASSTENLSPILASTSSMSS